MAIEKHPLAAFLLKIQESVDKGTFIKLKLHKAVKKGKGAKFAEAQLVQNGKTNQLSFTFKYGDRQEVKTFSVLEGVGMTSVWLGEDFWEGELFMEKEEVVISYNRKGKPEITFYDV